VSKRVPLYLGGPEDPNRRVVGYADATLEGNEVVMSCTVEDEEVQEKLRGPLGAYSATFFSLDEDAHVIELRETELFFAPMHEPKIQIDGRIPVAPHIAKLLKGLEGGNEEAEAGEARSPEGGA
jgi:hypothetical protein